MCDGSGGTSWSHDKIGRVQSQKETQITSGSTNITASTSYLYNLDGSVNSVTYPSTNIVSYSVGTAGRVTQVSDSSNNYVGYPLHPATYAPNGALASMVNGYETTTFSGIKTANSYNSRLQPAVLSAATPTQTIFSLSYGFNPGSNNGNVQQIVNNLDPTRSVVFAYDALNRISQANTTTTTGANCWGEMYTIDPWGNLTNIAGVSAMTGCKTEGLSAAINTNNQFVGWCYDSAGNLLDMVGCAPQAYSFVYDAEGQLQSPPVANTSAAQPYTYIYDGDGNRVQKCNANPCTSVSTPGTLYWRGPGGEVLDESSRSGVMQEEYVYFNGPRVARRDVAANNVHYYFADRLGSASLITDGSGNVQQQTDYYPYGGIAYTTGADPNHYKFTGKERDTESNLDMFGARYYGSSLVRFMIPDWAAKPTAVPYAMFGNPQSLNLYSYVNNNPTTTRDPDGHVAGVDDLVIGGIIVSAMAVAYLQSPPGQQMLRNAASSITSLGSSISSFFHPDNSGQNTAPPPTLPTNVSQGTPGTTATNVATGTPASTSQQGAVDTSPVESRLFPQGVKDSTRQNAGGQCEYCSTQGVPGQKSQPGVSTPANQGQTDHYNPYSTSQDSSAGNAVHACATCNNQKSDTQPQGTKWELPRMKKPDGQ